VVAIDRFILRNSRGGASSKATAYLNKFKLMNFVDEVGELTQ
jgi:hypothetical protein